MTSPAPLVCPHCQAPLRRGDAEPVTCPACGREVVVPGPSVGGESSIAGSDDDRAVTLVPSQDASTLTAGRRAPADSDAATEAWQRLLDGEGAGRYVESGPIARGGMGEIVLCIDRNIRRPVAMKRILPETADDPSRRARFVEEAQVTGQLEHPNIVPVHELDRAPDGTLYFTMKLVKGRSLADILRALRAAGPLPSGEGARRSSPPGEQARAGEGAANAPEHSLADLLAIFLKVCDGVAFAHSRGVVHRDLKPANIMVGDFGEVLVMDWGLAKIVGREDIRAGDLVTSDRAEGTPELTLDGTAMGTPAYMPPEQANGELDKIDHRSDIYSLGAILYELLTLEKPVEGETPLVVLANAAHGKIVPPEQRTPGRAIPRELSAIAMKCLAKLRSRRYQSVTELQRDITLHLEGRSVSASPDTFAQAVVKLVKRNKGISASVAAAAVVLIAVTVVFLVRLKGERDIAIASEQVAIAERKAAQDARDKQRQTALDASRSLAMQAVRAAEQGRAAEAAIRGRAAVDVMPDGPWGYYALALMAREAKELGKAREHLETALSLDQAHAPSRAALSEVLAAEGQLDQARELLTEIDQTTDWRSLLSAGNALMGGGDWREAVAVYERAVALVKKDASALPQQRVASESKLGKARAEAACAGFYESIRELPVDEQQRRVVAKLMEVHGQQAIRGFTVKDGVITGVNLTSIRHARWLQPLRGMALASLHCDDTLVDDLSPLKGMALVHLDCHKTPVSDLTPLRGMPLEELDCSLTKASDLSPLTGMPLIKLRCSNTNVSDVRPLSGMGLRVLNIDATQVSDLGPLKGMPLERLQVSLCPVRDLGPLSGMQLSELDVRGTNVSNLTPLQGMALVHLDCHSTPVTDLTPLAGMPLTTLNVHDCQRLSDLRPLEGMALTWLDCVRTHVGDLTPLMGMPLEHLDVFDCRRLADIGPLEGMPLTWLSCGYTQVSNLGPLKGMRLDFLGIEESPVEDLTPLKSVQLRLFSFSPKNIRTGITVVRNMKSIQKIGDHWGRLLPPEEFWRRYDAGEFTK